MLTDEQQKRLEALQAEKASKWKTDDRDREQLAELEELENEKMLRELVADLETKHGPRGKLWEIVDTTEGPIAVRCGEQVCYAKFLDASNSDGGLQIADMQDFILPNLIHPTREKYIAWCLVRGALPVNLWPILARLYRGVRDRAVGK